MNTSHLYSRFSEGLPAQFTIKDFTDFIYICINEYVDDDLLEELLAEAFIACFAAVELQSLITVPKKLYAH